MFKDSLKDIIKESKEDAKYNIYMMCGALKLKEKNNSLIISYHPLQILFLILITTLFGPVGGLVFISGAFEDAPLFAEIILIIIPIVFTWWWFLNLRVLFKPNHIEINKDRQQIIFHNPTAKYYYKGEPSKPWPKTIDGKSIDYCKIYDYKDIDADYIYNLDLYPTEDKTSHMKLVATQNKEHIYIITNYMDRNLDIKINNLIEQKGE